MPSGKTVIRLESHPAEARLARVENTKRQNVYPGPLPIPGVIPVGALCLPLLLAGHSAADARDNLVRLVLGDLVELSVHIAALVGTLESVIGHHHYHRSPLFAVGQRAWRC